MPLKDRLLAALPFSRKELELIIATAPFRYKQYKVPKRTPGSFRLLSQPTPEVKLIQRWVVGNEFRELPIHAAATAYRSGVGLVKNVEPHITNRFLLKVDFKDFFPSIKASDFVAFADQLGISSYDIPTLINILFKHDRSKRTMNLAIGAPSSPAISNLLLYPLDCALDEHCLTQGIKYTRYADDLSFSTNRPNQLKELEAILPNIIDQSCPLRLEINKEKTVHTSKKNGRYITGLTITSQNEISIGRTRKRLLRAQIDYFREKKLTEDEIKALKGYLSFLSSVEPSHIERLQAHYGLEIMADLLSPQS